MSDHGRGPYTPGSEPPLAFDDRRPRRGGGPAPVTLILSLLLLVGVGGGVFMMYRGGSRPPGGAPEPVGAPVRDVKVAAPPQAQTADPAAGLSIYKDDQGAGAAQPAFVPPPEQPTPRPVAAAPAAQPASVTPAPVATSIATTPATPAKPTSIDKILADNSDVKSPTKPIVRPAARPPANTETLAPAKTVATAQPAAASGPAIVQIGAFSTKTLADAGWNAAAATAPGGMAGKGKRVVPVVQADGSTLYRTSITGFASRDEAQALCRRLKAAGESCFVR